MEFLRVKSHIYKRKGSILLLPCWIAAITAVAAFNNGGYFLSASSLCQFLVFATVLLVLFFDTDILMRRWRRVPLISLALGSSLALWIGATIFWSLAPDQTLLEFNRVSSYIAIFLLSCLAGKAAIRPLPFAGPLLSVTTAVAAFALAAKVYPEFFLPTEDMARIFKPIGYSNALAGFAAMGLFLALGIACDKRCRLAIRMSCAVSAYLSILVVLMSFSRGGVLAALIAGLFFLFLAWDRIPAAAMISSFVIPAVWVMIWMKGQSALVDNGAALDLRADAGVDLGIHITLGLVVCLAISSLVLIFQRHGWLPSRVPAWATMIFLVAMVFAFAGYVSISTTFFNDPSGWVENKYSEFTEIREPSGRPERLLSLNSGYRWQLWSEALREWRKHPITGTGGQTFSFTHLKRREIDLFVKQPHSLPIQLMVENGIIGLALGSAFTLVVFGASIRTVILGRRKDSLLVLGMFSLLVVYGVQSTYEWIWNIPAISLAAFFVAGYLGFGRKDITLQPRVIPPSASL